MMRRDQDRMQKEEDDEYEDSYEEDSEEETDDESEEEGFLGARYAAVDQIMRGEAAGSSTDRAGGRLTRSVTWPAGQVFKRSALRRSSEPYQRKTVSFAEELVEMKEFVAFPGSPGSSDSSPARANPYRNMPVEELCLLSQHLNAELSLLSQMDPELHESVAGMTETGTDVSWEGGQAKTKVVHTVVALGPGSLNQEAAASSASGYSGHAFSSGLPGKAVAAMAPLSEVSQAGDALEEAAGVDGVGVLQESSTFSTTAAKLGVQSHCAEDEDVPQPEHEPADEASVLSVLEVNEGEKDEETDEEKDKKKDEKDDDEELTAFLVASASVASDAEQPEGEPSSLDQAYGTEGPEVKGGVDYYEIGSDTEKENTSPRCLETPRTHGRSGRFVEPPTVIAEHFMICNEEDGDPDLDVSGSEADGEDPFEALGYAPTEPESDLQASAGRADFAVGKPGQQSDLVVQQQTPEEAVKKMSSKEQMAAKMEERRRKLEGLLPEEPQEVKEVKEVKQLPMQRDTRATHSEKPPEGDTGKQLKVQHGPAQPAAEVATTVREIKQPLQCDPEATTSEKPSKDGTGKQLMVQHGPAKPAAEVATTVSEIKQPLQRDPEATTSEKPSKDGTGKQLKVQHGPAQPAAEVATTVSEIKQPMQRDPEATTSEKPSKDGTGKQLMVQHGPVKPAASEVATAISEIKQPVQSNTEAKVQHGPARQASSNAFRAMSSGATGMERDTQQPANALHLRQMLQESPKFGWDSADAQPRIGRTGSLPESQERPRLGILKKAKTESFVERPKALRFSTEVEIRDFTPRSPYTPSPLAQAVVVGTPVDPGSIQWLQQFSQGSQSSAASSTDMHDMPFGDIPAKPSNHVTQAGLQGSQMSPHDNARELLQRGRSSSVSLLQDVSSPISRSDEMKGPSHGTEAAHPQVLKGNAPASSGSGRDMPRDSRAIAPQPSRPLAQGAMQGSQNPALFGEGGRPERARSHSISLLPDLPTSCDSSDVMQGPSHSAEATHSKNFKVKVAHQGTSQERQKESLGSQASHASGFLTWKEPSSTCDPGHPSAVHHDSSSNRRRVRFQEPIATVAQYFYEMTQPNEEPDQPSQPQPLQADAAVLKTTVNCTSELTQMYTRRTGSKRAKKNQENHTHPSSSTHHNLSSQGGDEGFKNPIATVAQYLYQMTRPHEPQEMQPDQLRQPPPLQTTVNCSQELTDMYSRRTGHGSHRSKSRKHSPRSPREGGSLENIQTSQKEHSDASQVAQEQRGLAHDFEKRVLERAYFQYINGVSEDAIHNYFEALRIEVGQRPC